MKKTITFTISLIIVIANCLGQSSFLSNEQQFEDLVGRSVSLGDIDGDGDLDAFVTYEFQMDSSDTKSNKIWINDGDGYFTDSKQNLGRKSGFQGKGILFDIDGDQDLDIFIANSDAPCEVWLNNGKGIFSNSGQALGNKGYTDVKSSDLDADGDMDVFATKFDGFEVWLNNGKGQFQIGQKGGSSVSFSCALGDLDSDGDIDAVIGGFYPQDDSKNFCPNRIYLNDGRGNYTESTHPYFIGTSHIHYVELADFNNDNNLDLVVALTGGKAPIKIYFNDGKGGLTDGHQKFDGEWSTWNHHVIAEDVNNDGFKDLFMSRGFLDIKGENIIWLNDGKGHFTDSKERIGNASYITTESALGDLDGDGDKDVFIVNCTRDMKLKKMEGEPIEIYFNQLISK